MGERIDADDLALLASGFAAAMEQAPGAAEADAAIFELGWGDLLGMAPLQGAIAAFEVIGRTGAGSCLIDDVVAQACGLDVSPATCVVLPSPHSGAAFAGRVDGIVSARIHRVERVLVPMSTSAGVDLVSVAVHDLRPSEAVGLDPTGAHLRVGGEPSDHHLVAGSVDWERAVRNARVALAAQLVAISRWMLAEARQHAVDRVQFGRPIANFQALRHKMAESLVQIEGAAAVLAHCVDDECDPLLAALAKSLAGRAFRTTAAHAQQILAGIGFTTDHRFHLWLKRGLVIDTLFGSARTLPAEIGAALLARGEAPRLVDL